MGKLTSFFLPWAPLWAEGSRRTATSPPRCRSSPPVHRRAPNDLRGRPGHRPPSRVVAVWPQPPSTLPSPPSRQRRSPPFPACCTINAGASAWSQPYARSSPSSVVTAHCCCTAGARPNYASACQRCRPEYTTVPWLVHCPRALRDQRQRVRRACTATASTPLPPMNLSRSLADVPPPR